MSGKATTPGSNMLTIGNPNIQHLYEWETAILASLLGQFGPKIKFALQTRNQSDLEPFHKSYVSKSKACGMDMRAVLRMKRDELFEAMSAEGLLDGLCVKMSETDLKKITVTDAQLFMHELIVSINQEQEKEDMKVYRIGIKDKTQMLEKEIREAINVIIAHVDESAMRALRVSSQEFVEAERQEDIIKIMTIIKINYLVRGQRLTEIQMEQLRVQTNAEMLQMRQRSQQKIGDYAERYCFGLSVAHMVGVVKDDVKEAKAFTTTMHMTMLPSEFQLQLLREDQGSIAEVCMKVSQQYAEMSHANWITFEGNKVMMQSGHPRYPSYMSEQAAHVSEVVINVVNTATASVGEVIENKKKYIQKREHHVAKGQDMGVMNGLVVCKTFGSAKGCRFGDRCKFQHMQLPQSGVIKKVGFVANASVEQPKLVACASCESYHPNGMLCPMIVFQQQQAAMQQRMATMHASQAVIHQQQLHQQVAAMSSMQPQKSMMPYSYMQPQAMGQQGVPSSSYPAYLPPRNNGNASMSGMSGMSGSGMPGMFGQYPGFNTFEVMVMQANQQVNQGRDNPLPSPTTANYELEYVFDTGASQCVGPEKGDMSGQGMLLTKKVSPMSVKGYSGIVDVVDKVGMLDVLDLEAVLAGSNTHILIAGSQAEAHGYSVLKTQPNEYVMYGPHGWIVAIFKLNSRGLYSTTFGEILKLARVREESIQAGMFQQSIQICAMEDADLYMGVSRVVDSNTSAMSSKLSMNLESMRKSSQNMEQMMEQLESSMNSIIYNHEYEDMKAEHERVMTNAWVMATQMDDINQDKYIVMENSQVSETVLTHITKKQVHNAAQAAQYLAGAAFPSEEKSTDIFRFDLWKNIPKHLQLDDVKRALAATAVNRAVGRSIKPISTSVTPYSEVSGVAMRQHIDLLDDTWLVAVDAASDLITVIPLDNGKNRISVEGGIQKLVNKFKVINKNIDGRCDVAEIWSDKENVLVSIKPTLESLGISGTHAPAYQHEKWAESRIDVLKAAERTLYQNNKFPLMNAFVLHLRKFAARVCNVVPTARTGHHLTPYTIAYQSKPNADHMRIPYGAYVLYHNDKAKKSKSAVKANAAMAGITPPTISGSHLNPAALRGIVMDVDTEATKVCYTIYDIATQQMVNGIIKLDAVDVEKEVALLMLQRYNDENPSKMRKAMQTAMKHDGDENDDDELVDEDDYHEIVRIQAHRIIKKKLEILVRWKNCTASDDTWERMTNELLMNDQVKAYLLKNPKLAVYGDKKQPKSKQQIHASNVEKQQDLDMIYLNLMSAQVAHDKMLVQEEMEEREISSDNTIDTIEACHLTIKEAVKQFGNEKVQQAKVTEFRNIFPRGGIPVPANEYVKETPLGLHMHGEAKNDPQSDAINLKVRAVGGGDRQKLDESYDVSSPTVDINNFKLQLAIAAYHGWHCMTADIKGAFLHAELPENDEPIYIKIKAADVPEILLAVPEWKEYVRTDGSMVILLTKALYGLRNAPILWHKHIVKVILDAGWIQSKFDPCLFSFKRDDGSTCALLSLHVDDLFGSSDNRDVLYNLKSALVSKYGEIKSAFGDDLAFMSMRIHINREKREIEIDQTVLLEKIMKKFNITGHAVTPSTEHLFEDDALSPKCDQKKYQSLLYTLLFPARFTRPDVLKDVVFLTTKATDPNELDMGKLMRVACYLNRTKDVKLRFKPTSLQLHVYADASYAVHSDCKGHDGACISLGETGCFIYASSGKQKMQTKSSTESELVTLDKVLSPMMSLQYVMGEMGFLQGAAIIHQDNQSTIRLTQKGYSSLSKTKHIHIRFFYVKEVVESGWASIKYLPTEQMIADILTKPLTGYVFHMFATCLLNNSI